MLRWVTGIALGYGVTGSVDYISNGFGGTLGSVGITIILGAIISMAIEDTGAAKVIANFFIKLFRGKRMELAPALTAFIMSIPVFGDITMVLTAPIASMLSKRKHISMSTMASFTGLGLFLTHGLVPPTPGILAIALMFEQRSGYDHRLGIVVISFVGFFGTYFLLRKWTEKEWIEPNPEFVRGMEETDSDSVDDILIKDPGLPNTGAGFPAPAAACAADLRVFLRSDVCRSRGQRCLHDLHHHRQQGHRSVPSACCTPSGWATSSARWCWTCYAKEHSPRRPTPSLGEVMLQQVGGPWPGGVPVSPADHRHGRRLRQRAEECPCSGAPVRDDRLTAPFPPSWCPGPSPLS